ncbi:MAG TPA: GtrA family protein [Trebonia sp.]|jgi:putative flippase GtrA
MALPAAGLYSRYRHLVPELLKFCVVGGIGAVLDLGGAAVLHGELHVEALEAKAISTIIAMALTYLGSRFWTFKHRENQALGRELALFIVLNVIGLVIAEAVIAIVTYGLGLHSQLEYNGASVVGTGLATIFRYFAYRQWVFTAPADESVLASTAADAEPVPDYPPWDLDPAYAAAATVSGHADTPWEPSADSHPFEAVTEAHSWGEPAKRPAPRMETSIIPNGPVTAPVLAAPAATGQDLGLSASASSVQRSQTGRHRRH